MIFILCYIVIFYSIYFSVIKYMSILLLHTKVQSTYNPVSKDGGMVVWFYHLLQGNTPQRFHTLNRCEVSTGKSLLKK